MYLVLAFAVGMALGVLVMRPSRRKPAEFSSPAEALRYLASLQKPTRWGRWYRRHRDPAVKALR